MGRKRKRARTSPPAGEEGSGPPTPTSARSCTTPSAAQEKAAAAAAAAAAASANPTSRNPTTTTSPTSEQDAPALKPAAGKGDGVTDGITEEEDEGKVHRVAGGVSAAADDAPGALVVGLHSLEKLCFVGAALVRCGRGQADLSGFTLLPEAWGPYVEAHSPRWMGLLVLRALDAEDRPDVAIARGSIATDDAGAANDDKMENEIEEAIDRIAEHFPVVVVFKSLSGRSPLKFLSAQADADALYAPSIGADDSSDPVAESQPPQSNRRRGLQTAEGGELGGGHQDDTETATTCSPPPVASGCTGDVLDGSFAAELRLPGMQVVTTEVAGLRPLTLPQDWANAIDAVLASPPRPAGGGSNDSVLVCGAKGVGKSTLCRFLANRMLGRHREVAYMDCDLGQPEFTPPGQVSLHLLNTPVVGPPHANLRHPHLAYFIGTTTSKPEPLLYSAAVRALAERASEGVVGGAEQQQQHAERPASFFAGGAPPPTPLVVNTDGWVKGMGEDLLGAVIDAVRPRHIVQILGTSTAKSFELDLARLPEECEVHRVGVWSPPPVPSGGTPNPSRPSPQDQRTLRLVAYFLGQGQGTRGCGDVFPGGVSPGCLSGGAEAVATAAAVAGRQRGAGSAVTGTEDSSVASGLAEGLVDGEKVTGGDSGRLRHASMRGGKMYDLDHEVAVLLASARPRRVPFRAVQIRIMNGSVSPSLVLHAINGALVGLVAMARQPWEGGRSGSVGGGAERPPGEGLVCLAETPLAPCVGLGIVRSVDVEKRVLYVLTPEPPEVLRDVNVLVMGPLQLPMVMLYDPNWCSHPYFSSEVVGGGVIKNRNNLLRRGGQHA
ncbi:conserved unknown protein [Ectocarpus siliculosus]|uniref:Uncharacterized protein n=1 Tax=Ectocarpus siliculosus TaxID=2880 RepID=D8LE84_ECTSI|nr:conserved unknown protein [Ectocarpus siliculosus]|eukprot:CBN74160.1 conserved unknown protein [Ectocarpus siliculosus]